MNWRIVIGGVLGALLPAAAHAQFSSCYRLGLDQLAQGAADQASATLQRCIAEAGGNVPDPTIYTNLAYAQIQSGHLREAQATLAIAEQHKGQFRADEWIKVEQNKGLLASVSSRPR
jgi:hypothetical protein